MSEYQKCACPHCGQSIEYPAEGMGQSVPCPTCEKPFTLLPDVKIPCKEKLEIALPPAPESTPAQTSAQELETNVAGQPKTEWEEWIALNERLAERRIKSGIQLSDESNAARTSPETIPPASSPPPVQEYREPRPLFATLSESTICKVTKSGETPLHRAAKMGKINEIPKHLLTLELFIARDNSFGRKTPVHLAAEFGQLNKIPREFLTRETMTASTEYENKESRTGPTPPRTETPLHIAVRCGHADQIPVEFLTPEFLSIEASGYRETVLHFLARENRLDLVPAIYASSPMWNLRNSHGQTPREVVEANKSREAYVARVRSEPATEKQKEKLRWFGYAFEKTISKGEASDALDKCARDFPEKNRAYYNRPATDEQLAQLRAKANRVLTYGQAKDMISERAMAKRYDDRLAEIDENQHILHIHRLVYYRGEFCPHLTIGRVKKAAKALDKISPGWMDDKDCEELLLQKVAELNPEWAAKERWL